MVVFYPSNLNHVWFQVVMVLFGISIVWYVSLWQLSLPELYLVYVTKANFFRKQCLCFLRIVSVVVN